MAARSVSYWTTTAQEECGDGGSSPRSSRLFFSADHALDRSRMHINAKFLLDQLRQVARPDRLARRKLCSEKGQLFGLDLVWTAGASLLGHQPRNAASSKSALAW